MPEMRKEPQQDNFLEDIINILSLPGQALGGAVRGAMGGVDLDAIIRALSTPANMARGAVEGGMEAVVPKPTYSPARTSRIARPSRTVSPATPGPRMPRYAREAQQQRVDVDNTPQMIFRRGFPEMGTDVGRNIKIDSVKSALKTMERARGNRG